MKKILIITICLLVLVIALFNSGEKMEVPLKTEPTVAPQFTLPNLYGQQVSLSDFHNKPVMVNFWATWCVPCRNEMPEIENVYRMRQDYGLEVLAINLKESKDIVEKYVKNNDFSFQILLDEAGEVSDEFQLFGLPTTYFIDKEGVIQYSYMGEMTGEIINTGLKAISVKGVQLDFGVS
jgi:thiol-disulfide isomerase/thioredoxin